MRIQVNGKQIDMGDALREHVEEKLPEAVAKYAERPVEAVVTFSKVAHEFVCDVKVHISTGLVAKASDKATNIYAAFEGATERLEKQLRRYKRRLKNHHPQPTGGDVPAAFDASYSVLSSGDEGAEEPETLQPIIVAETKTTILSLSVGEAVMQMELADAPMMVFRNDKHGGVNVVYRREDGNIGWIDPRNLPTV